jgi:hypothetical protein
MKKLVMSMIIACVVSVNAFAEVTGSADPERAMVSLRKVDGKKVQLIYGEIPDGTITVKIYDSKNTLVQRDKIFSKEAFAKYYDFSRLEPANFTVEVYDNQGIVDQIKLVMLEESEAPVVYSKVEKVEGNKYRLLVNALLPSDLTVSIYENDRLIHEETLENSIGFQKFYNIAQKVSGSKVEFFVKSNNGFSKLLATK